MRILITNDDGIHAPGLEVLYNIALKFSKDVWICAPETDQSGLAHSLTLSEPLRLRKVGDKRFAVRGTPTDCVIMAVRELFADEPCDLVLSGVNSGQNIADHVTYSGTIAGAIEGTMLGIPSIALSQAYSWEDGMRTVPWETTEVHAPDIITKLLQTRFPLRTCINVNFPNCAPDEVEGIEITRQGTLTHGLYLDKRNDGRGMPYYWLRFGGERQETPEGTDLGALARNRISITALKLDLTDETFSANLRQLF